VLELTAAILLDSRAAADQVRGIFRHFVVDEFQDVNPLQKLLLERGSATATTCAWSATRTR
jgi:Superfamily I DNA and RNA helicases